MHPWCTGETLCLWWGSVLTHFLKLVPWVQIKAKQTEVIGCTCGMATALLLHRSLDVHAERIKCLGQGHWEHRLWLGARAGQPAFVFQHERHDVLSCFFLSFFILCLRSSPGLPYPGRYSSTKPPFPILFRQIVTFPPLEFLKYLFLTDFCAYLPFSLLWGRPSRCFLAHRTLCYLSPNSPWKRGTGY